ncbi:TetR family transcriptional regulator [Rhodococcus rhodochrous J45]|uniref:TetR family transcriptional regulator n=1 Tax=Rhodococcus rhodochrous J45 TaxID=935266 RepID=A0A562DIY5_RHORH|nr:TetR/AcrR family transcriptional regulator [Rhodococcus rhodochrous]TWH09565.1 TetR family transcriptional regulator [Rhodococcus rhodochrous J45]
MGRRRDTDGRTLLTSAALELFANHGIDGTSIRAVNRTAGLGPASVHYHFGTKEALIDEALNLYGSKVVESIVEKARILATRREPLHSRDLILMFSHAYDSLLDEQDEDAQNWIRLVDRLLSVDPLRVSDVRATTDAANAVRRLFPHARTEDIGHALTLAIRVYVNALAQRVPRLTSADESAQQAARDELQFMITFLAGGIAAALNESSDPID